MVRTRLWRIDPRVGSPFLAPGAVTGMGGGSSPDAQIAATRYLEWCKRQHPVVGFTMAVYVPIAVGMALLFPLTYWLSGGSW